MSFLTTQRKLVEMDTELIPVVEAEVKLDKGYLWVSSHDVIRSGIRHRLKDGDLIRVGKQVFEILGYVYGTRRYLVQAFEMEVTDEALTELLS